MNLELDTKLRCLKDISVYDPVTLEPFIRFNQGDEVVVTGISVLPNIGKAISFTDDTKKPGMVHIEAIDEKIHDVLNKLEDMFEVI